MIRFSKEPFSNSLLDEAMPLLAAHFEEVEFFKDLPIDPDVKRYQELSDAGIIHIYTARNAENDLVGYAVFLVTTNIHHKTSVQAIQDLIYVRPQDRGFGGHFISWCDDELAKLGVQIVIHCSKLKRDFGPLLESLGYSAVDGVYARRLKWAA